LYELLTGRRAFEGESPLTVLKKVLEHEPAPPRTLDPRLGRDVETIVLKAMDKDPSRRYESASALADDLDRELAGEPIRARRASLGYRLGKRFRRQPAVWTLAGLLLAALAGGAVFGAALWLRRRELERRELDRTRRREEARPHVDAGRTALARLKALRRRTPIDAEAVRSAETEALDELGRALRIDPDHPEALLESARVHAELERIPQAVDLCARAVAASERFATAYLERALLRLAAYEQLRHDAEGGTREENAESVALRRLIEDDLERVRRWSTDKRELSFAAGMIAFAGGKAREAAPLLRAYAAERVNDDAAWFWSGRAWLYFAEGRSDAVEDLTRAIEANPNGAAAYDSRGIAFNALRRWDRALADFDRAVELNPSYVPAWINRGVAYVGLGDRRAAIGCYDRAIGLDPNHANSYYNRGLSHLALNDLERAVADFTRAAELAPDMEEAFCNRGLAHVRRGDSKSALADFDRAIRIRPDFHTAYANRAVALAETGDVKRAVADLSRALELAPPDWKNREAAQRELGRLKAQLREDF
jgi:tetratricopeptide (TPR) repeat protein